MTAHIPESFSGSRGPFTASFKACVLPCVDVDMWMNDIALVKLRARVPSGNDTPEIQAVHLPPQGEMRFPPDNARCIMKGWGCQVGGRRAHVSAYSPAQQE